MTRTADLASALTAALFGSLEPGESLYAILDAARHPEIPIRLKAEGVQHDCLYQGPTAEALWFVAPYLARCERDSPFVSWLTEFGWGQSWGVFVAAPVALASLRQHLRKFLLVEVEGSEGDLYFRFYDPRVLREFLPTCAPEQTRTFFGPISCYIVETPSGALKFTVGANGSKQEPLPLGLDAPTA